VAGPGSQCTAFVAVFPCTASFVSAVPETVLPRRPGGLVEPLELLFHRFAVVLASSFQVQLNLILQLVPSLFPGGRDREARGDARRLAAGHDRGGGDRGVREGGGGNTTAWPWKVENPFAQAQRVKLDSW
jgi:hypothetical protein